ncbi:MAG: hypothetical protein MI975_11225 [Cytophagales bacterium]|nr:hypothetical protein [Cytophagales bacterium]
MLLTKFLFPVSILILVLFVLIGTTENEASFGADVDFMNGVSLVAPPDEFEENPFDPIVDLNADWVAIMPYSFTSLQNPEIVFDSDRQWWGETTSGTTKSIEYARERELKILLKPHVWVRSQGWTGDFKLVDEDDWETWEEDYEKYILHYVEIADSLSVEAFCIGLEFKHVVRERPDFWIDLIARIREIYDGKICYAANWDNFQNIPFWDLVDFIGINAYFPLSQKDNPAKDELIAAWKVELQLLSKLADKYGKPIVFTEFGYRSIDKAAGNQWELEHHRQYRGMPNFKVQEIAYEALFETVWDRSWFRGGFLWKWYPNMDQKASRSNSDYTPQYKPAEKVIGRWYKKR